MVSDQGPHGFADLRLQWPACSNDVHWAELQNQALRLCVFCCIGTLLEFILTCMPVKKKASPRKKTASKAQPAVAKIGIIGGSGLYNIEGLTSKKWVKVKTPFGDPSDEVLTGRLCGRDVVFLPRHARGHRVLPSELNHRANIWAMKKLGVEFIISVSAVGSLQAKYKPCDIVVIDQFFDRTKNSAGHTLFGNGIVAHVAFADPICEELRKLLLKSAKKCKAKAHDGGTYVNMEGPAFSTRAESLNNKKMGFDVIGMTNLGEAKCAREAEIAYATLAMVTDYDCWKTDEAHVTVEMVISNLMKNASKAKEIIREVLPQIPKKAEWPCHSALKDAIMTQRSAWPKTTAKNLAPVLVKYS